MIGKAPPAPPIPPPGWGIPCGGNIGGDEDAYAIDPTPAAAAETAAAAAAAPTGDLIISTSLIKSESKSESV